MPIILHPSSERKTEKTASSVSRITFDDDHSNPELTNFGLLVRLNDITLNDSEQSPQMTMNKNIEIIHLVLKGSIHYFDSNGNDGILQPEFSKLLSAGTGIYSGLKNHLTNESSRFLEIHILPDVINKTPKHEKRDFDTRFRTNDFQLIAAPNGVQQSLPVAQQSFISSGKFEADQVFRYSSKDEKNGIYFYVISGNITIGGLRAESGDGIGISEFDRVEIKTERETELLVIEVPMH